jgi:Uma2 family endonuclease
VTEHRRLAPGKYRLQLEDYERLAEAGAFTGHRTELIEGDVIVMSPQFRPHGFVKDELAYRLRMALEQTNLPWSVATEVSVALTADSEPQPDIVLTNEPRGDGPIPLPSVVLVIEVSDTTLDRDTGAKQRLYATAGILEYWVADVNGRVIHQMWAPQGDGYADRREIGFGEAVVSTVLDGLRIETAGL